MISYRRSNVRLPCCTVSNDIKLSMYDAKVDERNTSFNLVELYNSHPTYTTHAQTHNILIYNIIDMYVRIHVILLYCYN